MMETYQQALPHGITLSCRAAGARGRPLLIFLHGFPEAAFVWDAQLEHFAERGYRCIAPNLRGFENSSAPHEVAAYRPKFLVQDIAALIALEGGPLECLVAHDWGGALAWNLANQMPQLLKRLAILNSPHPGTFLRELKFNPVQQAASEYMNFLIRPDAEQLLAADNYRRLLGFLAKGTPGDAGPAWLTEALKSQYREVWSKGLRGGCNYYRASPLRPARPDDPGAVAIELPVSMLSIGVPTLVLWGLDDVALLPALLDGLEVYVADLTLRRVVGASHWIVHERGELVARELAEFIAR